MNWMRTILDGFAMAAYFNLFATAVVLYNPRLMFPSYPSAIIKNAPEPPSKSENHFYWLWIFFRRASAPLTLRGSQHGGRRHPWVLADGADRIHPVDDDKPVRPVFSGYLSHTEKSEMPFCNSWYGRAPWLWVQIVDEKLRIAGASVAMAVDSLSPYGGGAGRDRIIVDEIINKEEVMQ